MDTDIVVVTDIVSNASYHLPTVIVGIEIDIVLFEGSPEALYPGIVTATAATVHADLDLMGLERFNPFFARVLAALVGVDNLGYSICGDSPLKNFDGVFGFKS